MPSSLTKYLGLFQARPEVKISQSRRGIELNCAEQTDKKSVTVKFDCSYDILNPIVFKLIGLNYGLQYKTREDKTKEVAKSDLFAMAFMYNPKNFLYMKASSKRRMNKVGADHSSAVLLENATGDDKVMSFKFGSRFSRLA